MKQNDDIKLAISNYIYILYLRLNYIYVTSYSLSISNHLIKIFFRLYSFKVNVRSIEVTRYNG